VAKHFHHSRETYAGAEHLGIEGVSKLVGNNVCRDADRGDDLTQRIAKLAAEPIAAAGAGQEKAVGGERILGTQQTETMHF